VIGTSAGIGRLGLNRALRSRILPGEKLRAWARHHIEEIGNLENFLPHLYASAEATSAANTEAGVL